MSLYHVEVIATGKRKGTPPRTRGHLTMTRPEQRELSMRCSSIEFGRGCRRGCELLPTAGSGRRLEVRKRAGRMEVLLAPTIRSRWATRARTTDAIAPAQRRSWYQMPGFEVRWVQFAVALSSDSHV